MFEEKKNDTFELLAVWIGNEFGVFAKNAIVFSTEFDIELNEKGGHLKAILTLNPDYLQNFYGEKVSNINAVVGRNGVGKSTLLRYIKEMFIKNNTDLQERLYDIILFKEKNEIILYCHNNIKDDVHFEVPSNYTKRIRYYIAYPRLSSLFKDLNVIYYSNNLDLDQREQESTMYYNISTSFLMENMGRINARLRNKRIRNQNGIARFRYTEMQRQINFINAINSLENSPKIPFKEIEFLELRIHVLRPSEYQKLLHETTILLENEINDDNNSSKLTDIISKLKNSFNNYENINISRKHSKFKNFEFNFIENIRFSIIQNIVCNKDILYLCANDPEFIRQIIDNFLNSLFETSNSDKDLIKDQLNYIKKFLVSKHSYSGDYKGYMEGYPVAKKLQRVISEIENLINFVTYFFGILSSFSIEENSAKVSTKNSNISHILSEYYGSDFHYRFISFHWPKLSTGQESLIAFFSRLYELSQISNAENLILLIDEGDLYFHPQWQKDYLFYLFEFYKLPFVKYRNIQMVLTSHSSFILSDLLSNNVIFLENIDGVISVKSGKEKDILTFGGNIHDLLAHSFFIEGPFIGKFAEGKIQDLINEIRSDRVDTLNLVNHLGDSFLKSAIQNLLNSEND